jgi:hypothetical protein
MLEFASFSEGCKSRLFCLGLAQLRIELRKAKERLRHQKQVILGFIRQPVYEV